jgi:hypothetical protein
VTAQREIALAGLSTNGRHLVLAPRRGRPEIWRIDGAEAVPEPIDLGDETHRWTAIRDAADGTSVRLAAALERPNAPVIQLPGPSGLITGFVVWELPWAAAAAGETGTPHVLYADDDVRDVLRDEFGEAVLVRGRSHDHLWQLATGVIDRVPPCLGEVHGFQLDPERQRVVLVGAERQRMVPVGTDDPRISDSACFVDLATGSHHRLRIRGTPWAWDRHRTFASVHASVEIDLAIDPTPDDPAAFLAWLSAQTARELPLSALIDGGP